MFVVTDGPGAFNESTRPAAWSRMAQAGAWVMTWFGVACEPRRGWRNDVEGPGSLFANRHPDDRNLIPTRCQPRSCSPGGS